MFARKILVSTMTPLELWAISPVSKNISVGNTAKRSGRARNVPRDTLFILIIKLIRKLVVLESTVATVAPFSPGETASSPIEHFAMP